MKPVEMNESHELMMACWALPDPIGAVMDLALRSDTFTIGAGSWISDGVVCPIVAAATVAGVWGGDGILDGNPEWGSPDGPSPAVEDFAAWFDICTQEHGVERALATVRGALRIRHGQCLSARFTRNVLVAASDLSAHPRPSART